MQKAKVFMTRAYHPEATARLKEYFDVELWPENSTPPKSIREQKVAECDAIFTESYDAFDAEILQSARTIKIISNRAVGTDNLAISEATRRGILIGNTPGVLQDSCADFTFALLLDVARRVSYSERVVREGRWTRLEQTPYLGTDVHGQTLGIVGLGGIGTRVARRARGFDMKIIYFSRTRKPDIEEELGVKWVPDLESVLREADFVSLHMPLTRETERLIGRNQLRQMKPEAFLINTTRGRTVDQKALYEALSVGTIAGAGLDVADPEPVPGTEPLCALPNVVITPHIASGSSATFKKMGMMAAENIIGALMGQVMPSCLNPEALENRTENA